MTVRPLAYLLVFALGIGAAGLSACGSGSSKALIPAADAGLLQDDFDAVAAAIADDDCPRASSAVDRAQARVDSLPRSTSQRLRQRLRDGLGTLRRQAAAECVAPVETTTTETLPTDTTTTETLPTETLPTETTPTETLPTDTTTLPTPTPTPTPDPGGTEIPPDQGQQQGDDG